MRTAVLPVALALVAGSAAAAAQAAAPPGGASFSGSCDFAGRVTFSPALTAQPQTGRGAAKGKGTCTGTVVDGHGHAHEVDAGRSRYRAHNASDAMGCAGGPADGAGVLVIGATKLRFRLSETRAVAVSALQLDGGGWSGEGVANVDPATDPVDAAQRCGADGIHSVPITITLRAAAS